MSRWRLFGKSKSKEDEIAKPEEITEEETEEIEEEIEIEKEPEEEPLVEYHETLQTGVSTSKKTKTTAPSDQRIWRDVNNIEEKIDNLHIAKAKKPVTELDKTVDKLIDKQKKK